MPDAARPESKAATTIPTTVNCVRFMDSSIHRARELQAGRPLEQVLAVSAAVGRLAVATARVRSRCLVSGETASGALADLGPSAAVAAARKLDLARLETTPRSLIGRAAASGLETYAERPAYRPANPCCDSTTTRQTTGPIGARSETAWPSSPPSTSARPADPQRNPSGWIARSARLRRVPRSCRESPN